MLNLFIDDDDDIICSNASSVVIRICHYTDLINLLTNGFRIAIRISLHENNFLRHALF